MATVLELQLALLFQTDTAGGNRGLLVDVCKCCSAAHVVKVVDVIY